MSINFFTELGATLNYRAECGCGAVGPTFSTYNAGAEWLGVWVTSPTPLDGCTDDFCLAYAPFIVAQTEDEGPTINLANANAMDILAVLGLDSDNGAGSDDAANFLGRVLMAQAVAPLDEGIPAHDVTDGSGIRVINCGRRPGYTQETLVNLHAVAEHAVKVGRDVVWS